MSLHRKTRRQLLLRQGSRMRRTPTPMGRLYRAMRVLRLGWVFTKLMRKPCHVADIYIGDRFYDERYLMPAGDEQDLRYMKACVRQSIQSRSMVAMVESQSRFEKLLIRK